MDKIVAYVLIRTRVGAERTVAARIRGLTAEVLVTYGTFDVVARIEASDLEDLDRRVSSIRADPDVLETVTLVGTPL